MARLGRGQVQQGVAPRRTPAVVYLSPAAHPVVAATATVFSPVQIAPGAYPKVAVSVSLTVPVQIAPGAYATVSASATVSYVPHLSPGAYASVAVSFTITIPHVSPPTTYISVREKPALKLSVYIEPPGNSPTYRWGGDDPKSINVPNAMSFSTAMPGGFDQCQITLERDPRIDYPDLTELSTLTVFGMGGSQVAYQGRIEEFPSQAGSDYNIQPTVNGWQAALQDDSGAVMVFADQDLTQWTGPQAARELALAEGNYQTGSTSVAEDPTGLSPALIATITDDWQAPYQPIVEAWYMPPAGVLVAYVWYKVRAPGLGGTGYWNYELYFTNSLTASSVEASGNLSNSSEVSGRFVPANPTAYAYFDFQYEYTPYGQPGAQYNCYWDQLQIFGSHGLPIYDSNGTLDGSDGPYTMFASDIVGYVVGRWASPLAYSVGSSGTIKPSSYGIAQLTFTSATTALAMIQQATQFELLDYAVWEGGPTGRPVPTFYMNERGLSVAEGGRSRAWQARVGPAQLQNAGPQVSRIYNGVIATFQAPDGTSQSVGPPANPITGAPAAQVTQTWGPGGDITNSVSLLVTDPSNAANAAGVTRYYLLNLGTSTLDNAAQAAYQFLVEQEAANTSGQAALVGHVQDTGGTWWPAWMVRAGDTIAFIDASDPSPRRVVSTSYDDPSKTNTVQLDVPPDTMTALLARMSAALAPIGLQ